MYMSCWSFGPADASRIHWRAPTLMTSCLFIGIAFILFHHFLYQFLDGQTISDDLEQQWVVRGGTAIAFIVKLALTTTTATAYVQWFWYQLRRKPTKLKNVDTMFGAITNAWNFLEIKLWFRNMLLAIPAIVTWLLPIAAVITPGTLIVKPALYQTNQPYVVTQNEFSSLGYASQKSRAYIPGDVILTTQLESIELLTMNIGSIVSIPKSDTSSNITYTLSFDGPAVSCTKADNETTNFVNQTVTEFEATSPLIDQILTFVPQPGFGPDMNASFYNKSGVTDDFNILYLDTFSDDASKVMIRWNMGENNGDLISCAFYNATYTTHFQLFSDGQQSITTDTKFLNDIAAKDHLSSLQHDNPQDLTISSYLALMYSFGEKVSGRLTTPKNTSLETSVGSNGMPLLVYSPKMLSIARDANTTAKLDTFTSALETLFQNFTLSARYAFQASDFSSLLSDLGVYTNITTPAHISLFRNQFSYDARDLLITYALCLFWALICTAMGFFAIKKIGGSYSFNFSTVLRVTRDPELGGRLDELERDDVRGADPLPKSIKSALIRQGTFGSELDGDVEKQGMKRKETGLGLGVGIGLSH